jgi:hypothetical protein
MLFLQHNHLVALPDVTGCMALKELHLADNIIKVWATSILLGLVVCVLSLI